LSISLPRLDGTSYEIIMVKKFTIGGMAVEVLMKGVLLGFDRILERKNLKRIGLYARIASISNGLMRSNVMCEKLCEQKAREAIELWWSTLPEVARNRFKNHPVFRKTLQDPNLQTPEGRWNRFGKSQIDWEHRKLYDPLINKDLR
jgi:hypothetical protein